MALGKVPRSTYQPASNERKKKMLPPIVDVSIKMESTLVPSVQVRRDQTLPLAQGLVAGFPEDKQLHVV